MMEPMMKANTTNKGLALWPRITRKKKNLLVKIQQSKNVFGVDSYKDGGPRGKIF